MSVFGPGFGECILLHLGDGDWAVIDSCLDATSKQPAALHYLNSLSANPATSIQLVVATHWHDDHMDGILAELKRRKANTRHVAPKLASVGKSLWPAAGKPNPLAMSIKCLSPSDAAVLATISRLKGVAPSNSKVRRRLPRLLENDTSVVLSVEAGGHRVLLGGDLHVKGDRSLGWLAIVDDHAGVNGKHHAFKVPHHGSPTGHHDEVWDKMVARQTYAVTTPFVGGSVRLPSVDDCQRILSKTQNAYLSAPPAPGKFRDVNKAVERTVQEATRSAHFVPGKYGHVRLRKNVTEYPSAPWGVELFGSAVSMADYIETTG